MVDMEGVTAMRTTAPTTATRTTLRPLSRQCQIVTLLLCLLSFVGNTIAIKCALNPFYNPVCGSDNRMYGNMDMLNCYNKIRPRQRYVKALMHRDCKPLICPSYQDLVGPWQGSAPVCANNGYTYGNIHQVQCLKDFMPNLAVLHEGGCTLHEVRQALGKNVRRKACAERRIDFEVNAICATNNVTYSNPFQLLCQNSRLRERTGGKCGCPFQRSCAEADRLMQTLRFAPAPERTRFLVCGNDQRTYRSQAHLECARRFNSNLYMLHRSPCAKRTKEPCPNKLQFVKTPTPVCGSDGRSYISHESLVCAQRQMNKNIKYLHSGACVRLT